MELLFLTNISLILSLSLTLTFINKLGEENKLNKKIRLITLISLLSVINLVYHFSREYFISFKCSSYNSILPNNNYKFIFNNF